MEETIEQSNQWVTDNFPVQDDTWPSRRWNVEMTDYMDLSGNQNEQ